ncbi:Gfo/Idh/MocA family protein [Desulforhopalus sp. 52FAK]
MSRFLVVGYGSIGKRHIRNIKELFPDSKVTVLRRSACSSVQNNHMQTDVDLFATNLDDALADPPQIAIIAGPAPFHIEIAIKLAHVGVHLLIEKPLSDDLDGADELLRVCKEKKVALMVGYNLRFLDSLQKLKFILDNGEIGDIISVRCEVGQYLPGWRPDMDYRESVSAQRKLGGGVLLELSHEIDFLIWFFGDVLEVTASISTQSQLDIDVEDTAHLILRFKRQYRRDNLIVSLNMDFVRQDTTRQCSVIGERGTLRWDGIQNKLELFTLDSGGWQEVCVDNSDRNITYQRELMQFVEHTKSADSSEFWATGQSGKKVLEVIEGARRSAEERRTILVKS